MPGPRKRFLFTVFDGGGNLPPPLAVAAKLVRLGHDVRVIGDPSARADIEAAHAHFIPWKHAPYRLDRRRENDPLRDWAAATPEQGLRQLIDLFFCGPALGHALDVTTELRRAGADLVVCLDMLLGVVAGCESTEQRLVLFSPGINMYPQRGLPPFGPGLTPARTPAERALHAEIAANATRLFDTGLPALNAARRALGLPPLRHVFDQTRYAVAHLLATSRAFDFPSDPPPEVRYVGPQLSDPAWAQPWQSPWSADDARPLVLVSFSTTYQNHVPILQRLIDALGQLPVRALITLGVTVRPQELQAPLNCVIVGSAPHSSAMSSASLVVTHGGHGTVMAALSHRLPMLVIPQGRDQMDNAARITTRGAGLALPANAQGAELTAALKRLLTEPAFREAARRLGDAVAAEVEQSSVIDELERAASPDASAPQRVLHAGRN
jgi:UDP:flavonoid glycosyltransferase YjiC (YdhE family)